MTREEVRMIRKGDILRARSGALRVVREVSHGRHTSISLTIQRCSWTRRCYTVYIGTWEIASKFERTPYRLKLNREIDLKIEKELGGRPKEEIELHCCDVSGIG